MLSLRSSKLDHAYVRVCGVSSLSIAELNEVGGQKSQYL